MKASKARWVKLEELMCAFSRLDSSLIRFLLQVFHTLWSSIALSVTSSDSKEPDLASSTKAGSWYFGETLQRVECWLDGLAVLGSIKVFPYASTDRTNASGFSHLASHALRAVASWTTHGVRRGGSVSWDSGKPSDASRPASGVCLASLRADAFLQCLCRFLLIHLDCPDALRSKGALGEGPAGDGASFEDVILALASLPRQKLTADVITLMASATAGKDATLFNQVARVARHALASSGRHKASRTLQPVRFTDIFVAGCSQP
jgi:hypothetical protein